MYIQKVTLDTILPYEGDNKDNNNNKLSYK